VKAFARRGLARAGHADVAQDAGVSVSTVFLYFPSRADLVDAVLAEVRRFLLEMAENIHRSSTPARERVRRHVQSFADAIDAWPDHVRVWLDWSTAIREEVWPRYLAFQDIVVALVAATIERGQAEGEIPTDVDAKADARLLIGSAHMIAQMKFSDRPREELRRFIDAVLDGALGRR
jgi:TetR/AcrR family hemagglutinin/protease transcriptional regulator